MKRTTLGVENQSFIFKLFTEGVKLSVADVYEAARIKKLSLNEPILAERTVRRAINNLERGGFIVAAGKQNNAILYAKQGTSFASGETGQGIIPIADDLVSVEHFLKVFGDIEIDPFTIKVAMLSPSANLFVRRMALVAVLSADSAGFDAELKRTAKRMHGVVRELEHITKILTRLLDSPIWYEQYRQRIAYELRHADPDVLETARALIKGE